MSSIHNFQGRIKREEILLEEAPISEENKALIRRFIEFKIAEGVKPPRIVKYYSALRLLKIRYLGNHDFTAVTKEDLVSAVAKIEGSELSDWSKHDYTLVLKTFYKWLDRPDITSWMKVKNPGNKILPEDLVTEEDVQAMINAAMTDRDKAFIACLYEGGLRIGEIGGLTLKDIRFDRYGAVIMVKGKTGMRPVRLIFAAPYLARWIEVHPGESKSSPLWIGQSKQSKEIGLRYDALNLQLKRIAERAGIKHKVNPHIFRHARATNLSKRLTDSLRDKYLGLIPGSKMGRVYIHLSGRDLDHELLEMYGLESEEKEDLKLKSVQCPHCKAINTTTAPLCINCKLPLSVEGMMAQDEEISKLRGEIKEIKKVQGRMEELDNRLGQIIEDPEVQKLLSKKLNEMMSEK